MKKEILQFFVDTYKKLPKIKFDLNSNLNEPFVFADLANLQAWTRLLGMLQAHGFQIQKNWFQVQETVSFDPVTGSIHTIRVTCNLKELKSDPKFLLEELHGAKHWTDGFMLGVDVMKNIQNK